MIILDGACNVYGFPLPESLPQPQYASRSQWSPLWKWTGAASDQTQVSTLKC